MATITTEKRTKVLPLSYIKYLPMAYAPSFYEKAAEVLQAVEDETIVDSIVVFKDLTQEFLTSMETATQKVAAEVIVEFDRISSLWRGVKHLFKAYATSYDAHEATLGKKALGLYQAIESEPMRRTNAAVLMQNLVSNISRAWNTSELTGTFLESWKTAMTSAATAYAAIYQNRLERAVGRTFFTDQRDKTYEAFEFAYFSLYTFAGNTGDLAASKVFAELNDLVVTYTAIAKARSTRIANKNAAQGEAPQQPTEPGDQPAQEPEQEEVPTIDESMPSQGQRSTAELVDPTAEPGDDMAEESMDYDLSEGDYEDWDE